MEWQDDAIVIGLRRHGESAVILEALTRRHGRHLGLVHGGRSRRLQAALQPGNGVSLHWRARIDDQLGTFTAEASEMRAARFLDSPVSLAGLGNALALIRLLPERDPHPALYETLLVLADSLSQPQIVPALSVRFELAMLAELGVGLDLSRCAATGMTGDLAFVSPKSARAVSRAAGEPYAPRLLPLPAFLIRNNVPADPTPADIRDGFRLTGFFLERDVFGPRGLALPDARGRLLSLTPAG